jgi:dipeptidyl aminopeptidase/acylaminoacyl peptidase
MCLRLGLLFLALLALFQAEPLASQPAPTLAKSELAAGTRPARIPTDALTERSGLSDLKLSPDGSKIALRAVGADGKVQISILDSETRRAERSLTVSGDSTLEWTAWAGNKRLLVSLSRIGTIYGEDFRYSRLYVYDLDTRSFTFIGKKGMGIVGDDVLHIDPAGQYILLAMQRSILDWPAVWRFPLDGTAEETGKVVQKEQPSVWAWYADNDGVVRLAIKYLESGALEILYRKTQADEFKRIAKLDKNNIEKGVWQVLRIVGGSDQGFVLQDDGNGRQVLRHFNYATGQPGEVFYAQPGWDIESVWIGEDQKPVAVFYADDRDRVVWFDPKMKALQARLEKALKVEEVLIGSRARDDSRLLVWAGSEADPGMWYVYTAASAKLEGLFAEKPRLDLAALARPQPISYPARDGTKISGYLTLPVGRAPKGLPLIILPHGGPYGIRDKLDFDTEVQFLANRGYAVLQPNYRGSGGYGEAFETLGDGQIGRKMQDDLDDGMDWAVTQGFVDPKRVCVVGTSYGGYAALWAVTRNPERYRCAASFAGVTDWNSQLRYDRNYFTRDGSKKWKRRVSGEESGFNLDMVSPAKLVTRLTRPVLLAHGEKDTNVPFKQFKGMRDGAAKGGISLDLLVFPDEGHGFDKAENETKWLDRLGEFLTKHNPAD